MTKQLPYRVISLTKPKAGLAFSSLQHQGIKASLPCSDLIHAPLNVYRSRLCDGDSANTDGLISEALAFKNHFCLFNFFSPLDFPRQPPLWAMLWLTQLEFWLARPVQSRLQLLASPSSPAHLEVCKWALQTDTVFCSLFDKSLLWPLSSRSTHKSPQPMEAGYQIQIPYMWK